MILLPQKTPVFNRFALAGSFMQRPRFVQAAARGRTLATPIEREKMLQCASLPIRNERNPVNSRTRRAFAASYLILIAVCAAAADKRSLDANDFDRLLAVDSPVCSRDGRWIAYTVEGSDLDADERKSSIWMVNYEGTEDVRLTGSADSASNPKFSPDGRYVSFLSTRGPDAKAQIYLLDRRGGEAQALTSVSGDIGGYDWSPDGSRLVISMSPGEAAADGGGSAIAHGAKAPKPIVTDRLHFKEDVTGYLTAADHAQLNLLDIAAKKLEPLTADSGMDDTSPTWSPDGKTVAFFGARDGDADQSGMRQLYLLDARPGSSPRKLADFYAPNKAALLWTTDGKHLIFTSGLEARLNAYIQDRLSIVAVGGGNPKVLTERLDRALSSPALAADGASVNAILEDDGVEVPVGVRLDTGSVERRVEGKLSATALCSGGGHVAAALSTDSTVPEIYAIESAGPRKLTSHNDELVSQLALGPVEEISFPSRDGTKIHGLIVKPANFQAGRTYPTLLWIHGGPNGQDSHGLPVDTYALALERQWFAAHGYVVLAPNYRGSSGRGAAFANTIAADWGNKEVADLLAAVDYAVREKIADPRRLGIGGWSYGGILTDYTIASDPRFKAAISGAGSGNQLSMYGSDEYILQYNAELGPPWRTPERWLRVSYPFFHADRIKTPTLFLGGDKDFNVPIAGGEQMYAALRTLGVPTQLVVYPGQFHLLTRPSFIKDCVQRYLEWFDRYLAPAAQ
jgi:dipeptidyl aminopeptidase/acylaminoacyl peptidase